MTGKPAHTVSGNKVVRYAALLAAAAFGLNCEVYNGVVEIYETPIRNVANLAGIGVKEKAVDDKPVPKHGGEAAAEEPAPAPVAGKTAPKPDAVRKNPEQVQQPARQQDGKDEKTAIINSIITAANIQYFGDLRKGVVDVKEDDPLNLRPCPKAIDDCEPIAELGRGTIVKVLGLSADGRWYEVKYNNVTAFANARFIKIKMGY